MKKYILLLAGLTLTFLLQANNPIQSQALSEQNIPDENEEYVPFSFQDEKIIDIINKIAALENINIILPEKLESLQTKINFSLNDRIPLSRAWSILQTLLDMAGFLLIPKGEMWILKTKEELYSSPLPFWGGTMALDCLPDTDEPIRFLYPFININIADQTGRARADLQAIFNNLLQGTESKFIFDERSNSVLLTGSSIRIKSVMAMVQELDKTGFRESISVLPLEYADPKTVVEILNKLIPGAEDKEYSFMLPQARGQKSTFFSRSTRIVPMKISNAVVIMGKIESVDKVIDFIKTYIDKPLTKERVFHLRRLNYLSAEETAPVLMSLIKQKGSEQSSGGKDDFLAGVIIIAEKVQKLTEKERKLQETDISKATSGSQTKEETALVTGGNNLIVAARENDWILIEQIIDQIDRPQLQVAFEVVIADITYTDEKSLQAQLRGLGINLNTPNQIKWQSSLISPEPILNYTDSTKTTINSSRGLNSDLSQQLSSSQAGEDVTFFMPQGTSVLEYKDANGIGAILAALKSYSRATILSQPFIVTSNHQQANIEFVRQKLGEGSADQTSTGGPVIINNSQLDASLSILLLPQISISNEINLQIKVSANEFVGDTSTRTLRVIHTNANIYDKELLVLGGLTRTDTSDTSIETPLLSKIPIVGNLFRKRSGKINRDMLLIFISPTIIRPLLSGGTDIYTKNKERILKANLVDSGENFENLKDPVYRLFFPESAFYARSSAESLSNFARPDTSRYASQKTTELTLDKQEESEEPSKIENQEGAPSEEKNLNEIQKPIAQAKPEKKAANKDPGLKEKLSGKQNPFKKQDTKAAQTVVQ
jgi:type II secretory pathway component GspD/PulD (secretin)